MPAPIPPISMTPSAPLLSTHTKTRRTGAAYIRVSTDDQTELSPDAQVRVILNAAEADGYVIPKEYIFIEKKGISGRKADNRPEFQRMIAIAKSQHPAPFDRLYLWKFSRFARNQEESTFYKGILRKKCSVDIKSVSEPIMEGMFGRLIETIIEWFDEYYSFNLSGEVLRGMTEKALREGYQSTPCLGYDAAGDGRPFIINPKEYAIAEYLFQSYHSGMDMNAVTRAVNRKGYLTKRGNPFDRRSIYRILTNSFYKGIVTWNGISFEGAHETRPAITAIYDEVQERIKREHRPHCSRDISSNAHWLSGLLKCSTCGSSLGYNRSGDQKKRPDFFQCWKYAKGIHPGSCCVSVRIAEQAVLESLEQITSTGSVEYEYKYVKKTETAANAEAALLQHALARLETKEYRIREAYEEGIDTLEEYKQNRLRLQVRRSELMEQFAVLQELPPPADSSIPDKQKVLCRISTVYELIHDPDVAYEIKGSALRSVVKQIVFDRSENVFKVYYYTS